MTDTSLCRPRGIGALSAILLTPLPENHVKRELATLEYIMDCTRREGLEYNLRAEIHDFCELKGIE
jgi:hypothetical protein